MHDLVFEPRPMQDSYGPDRSSRKQHYQTHRISYAVFQFILLRSMPSFAIS
jgi:hypothetical protein